MRYFLTFVLIFSGIMANRYQTKEINDFSGGEGQEFFDQPNRFWKSTNLELDITSKIAKISTLHDYTDPTNIGSGGCVTQFSDGYYYKQATREDTNKLAIFKSADGISSWSKVYDFPDGGGTHYVGTLFAIKSTLIAVVSNGYSGKEYIYSSTDGTTWTFVQDLGLVTSGRWTFTSGEDSYYIMGKGTGNKIYKSKDGASWSLFFSITSGRFIDLEWFEGFLYVVNSNGSLEKNELIRIENNSGIIIKNFIGTYPPEIQKIGENLLIAILNRKKIPEFYFWDGASFILLGRAESFSQQFSAVTLIGSTNDRIFAALTENDVNPNGYSGTVPIAHQIMSINKTGAFVKERDLGIGMNGIQVYISSNSGKIVFDCERWGSAGAGIINRTLYDSNFLYQSYGELETSSFIIGPHIPVGYLLIHNGAMMKSTGEVYPFARTNIRITPTFDDFVFPTIDAVDLNYARQAKYSLDPTELADGQYQSNMTEYRFKKPTDGSFPYPFIFSKARFKFRLEADVEYSGGENTPQLVKFVYIYQPTSLLNAD